MSARKQRPTRGTAVTSEMSMRDKAAALGVSTAELHRWISLSELPEGEFERRLAEARSTGAVKTSTILTMTAPVPARGRVERAQAIVKSMNDDERRQFVLLIGGAQ